MRSNILNWNVLNRDLFVTEFAKKFDAEGLTVLDVGAGDAPYRNLFTKYTAWRAIYNFLDT